MITLSQIFYRYPNQSSGWTLQGINLSIRDGEFVLICGTSGSGKSTLGYLFNGLIPHFFGGTLQGSVTVNGSDTRNLGVSDFLPKVGIVFQNPDAQLFNSTVENEIAFGLESLGLSASEIGRRIRWVTETLHIEHLLDRSPMALSGGEKRLVGIASVLCLNPLLLLLDEPFAHLDRNGIERVREALFGLQRAGKTIVAIEQRVEAVLQCASRCVILDKGRILFDGTPRDAHPVLLSEHLVPQYPKRQRTDRILREPALSVQGLFYSRNGRTILEDITFEVKKGESVAIVGPNGSGKTTLIKHFNGLNRPTSGSLAVMGEPVLGKPAPEMASLVGISFQNPNDQFFKNHVRDELLVGPKISGNGGEESIKEITHLFHLEGLLDRSPYRLSEGQKKRVALASIVVMHPELLVIDEPTVGQDGRSLEAMSSLIRDLEDRGLSIVIVTHDLDFAAANADRWILLQEGRVSGNGLPQRLFRAETLIRREAYGKELEFAQP